LHDRHGAGAGGPSLVLEYNEAAGTPRSFHIAPRVADKHGFGWADRKGVTSFKENLRVGLTPAL